MKFRYDFGEKLDLSRFVKQAPHYINLGREIDFELYVHDFKINLNIATPDRQTAHTVSLFIEEIKRDTDGNIKSSRIVTPLTDTRFQEIQSIQAVFDSTSYKCHFNSNSSAATVDKICKILKLLHKINGLKAFI